jgi:DNA-binding CsgD family transcriptional regulator/PAS domain-containing protein
LLGVASVDRTLHGVLTMLYAAPMSPGVWPQALVGVTDLLGLSASAIVRTDLTCKANSVSMSHGVDPEAERLYAMGYGNQDVYRPRFLRMQGRQGELLMGDELCSVAEMKNTAFYEDILLKADIRLWCAVATECSEGIIENISFYHRWKEEAPGADSLKLAQAITPHLNNALRLRARLAQLEGLARDLYAALDQADTGIVLLDEHGCCAFVNRVAKQIFDQVDGLVFSKNRMVAMHPQERSVLEELVHRAVAGVQKNKDIGAGTLRITRLRGRSLHLRIAPFPSEHSPGGSQFAAIALIGDPDRAQRLPLQTIRAVYGLTPAEARLALLLLEGKSIAEAAQENEVSKDTVRSQLKQIFLKTGTRRQGELICLLASLPGGDPGSG